MGLFWPFSGFPATGVIFGPLLSASASPPGGLRPPGCLGHFWAFGPKGWSIFMGGKAMGHRRDVSFHWLVTDGTHRPLSIDFGPFKALFGPKIDRGRRFWVLGSFLSHFWPKMGSHSGVGLLGADFCSFWGKKGGRRSLVILTRLRRRPFWGHFGSPNLGFLAYFG